MALAESLLAARSVIGVEAGAYVEMEAGYLGTLTESEGGLDSGSTPASLFTIGFRAVIDLDP